MATAAQRRLRGIRLRALHIAGAAVVALVLAGTVVGADGISPATTTVNLGVGSSTTIHNTLHLDALPPKADVLLALDTTGSMGTAITEARDDAKAIVDGIHLTIPGARFAVAEFKDYPVSPFGGTGDFPWMVKQNFTDNSVSGPCLVGVSPTTPIECALNGLTASGGSDNPEAYNRAFYEAYHDPALQWGTGAAASPRFMVVLGDSLPHDATQNANFPACPNTPPTDPGPDGSTATNLDDLKTEPTLTSLRLNNTNLSFVTYNPAGIAWGGGFTTAGCQKQLAEYTGGKQVTRDGTGSLKDQIVTLINQAASHVDKVDFTVTGGVENPGSWFSFNPPLPYGPITAPADVPYDATVTVPQTATPGTYNFDIHAIADGSERAVQHVTVNVSSAGVSSLAMTADEPSVPAGIASVPFTSIPGARLGSLTADVGSAAAGSIAAGSIAAGSIASGSIAAGSIAAGSIAAGSIAAGSIAAGSIAAGSIGFADSTAAGSIAAGSIPSDGVALKSVLLSQIPLVGTTWADILKGSPFVDRPLQAVTLYEVANYAVRDPSDNKTPWERLMALPLRQVPFFQTLWRSVPFGAILLGNATLDQLPPPKKPDGTQYATWSDAIAANGGSMDGVTTSTNTVFGLAISGNLGTTAVGSIAAGSIAAGSIAAGSIAAGSIAAGSIAAGSIDLRVTHLGTVPLTAVTSLADIVICGGGFNCTGKTLGDASAANAIRPTVTLAYLLNHLSPPYDTISIDEIAQAILAVAEYPWEQINVQGLQDIAGTGQNVHYHVDFDLVCTLATGFSVHVKLPKGFFPVAGSSKFSYAGGTPLTAVDPTAGDNGPVWSTIPGSPCGGGTATRHVRLDFTSYAGLTIGAQASDVDVTTAATATYAATNQAPVVVTQNWEPSGNPDTAPTIDKNTLVVGHVATGDDADFYRFPLTGLAPGTKVTAYLKVPRDADLDLVVNKPGAPAVQSSASGSIAAGSIAAGSIAAGSIAAGSIPIEDVTPGVDNSRGALQPDAAADIASGSIASGSIAAGSISANRGGVNEVAQIVTRGETGAAVIGVSGYNSAFSAENYVLRIKVISPPALPPCDPVTGLGTLAPATPLPLPTANDPTVKALFLVNRQRLAGLYGAAADSLFGVSSPLTMVDGVAERVGGKVLPVDGDATVRNAYAAWDQNPCSINAANTVVRSINNLVATYRVKYPSLKYVVLLGTDQALPMWRQQDLTAVSPEIDEANDLAFTTSGLTKGNALYAAAAQNAVLTDGAYGAFKERTWLGHDIPLPEVSVSRLVETPDDILGQLNQFLSVNGHLDLHTALTTGDSFFADGAQAANASLGVQLPGLTRDTLLTTSWTRDNLFTGFFSKVPVPDVGALWAHYSHWTAQPANLGSSPPLATTGDVVTSHSNGQLLFTVGCHSGLNVPDLIAPVAVGDTKRLQDWAQTYMQSKSAVYVANTGFGYGDTTTIDLSERLMDHFADNINSGGTIGEQWIRALHRYYSEPSNYDVIDEKVMVEATMYGLPFYDFDTTTTTPQNVPTAPTPPSHGIVGGLVDTAQLPLITANIQQNILGLFTDSHPDGTTYLGTNNVPLTAGALSVFYRPIQPTVSRDVTINDPINDPTKIAHGAWIRSLTTDTFADVTPVKPFPLVHSADDAPAKDYPNTFFPAGVVTVNRDFIFGKEQDTAVVNLGKFFPNTTGDLTKGTEQVVKSIGIDIGYSDSLDSTPPLITQVGAVKTASGTFTAFVRVTDAGGSGLNRVAVLYTTGNGTWAVQPLTTPGGGLWTGTIPAGADSIRLDGEAQDNAGNVGFSFNKAVNFQSVADTGKPTITLDRPLPNALFTLNDPVLNPLQQVRSSFSCSDPGGVKSCLGGSDLAPGQLPTQPSGSPIATDTLGAHTFTVTSTDLALNTTTKTVNYYVLAIFGFKPPVDNPPILNVLNAGNTTPVKWTLKDASGNYVRSLGAFTSVSSMAIKCTPGATDPDPDVVPSGLAGLKYDLAGEQFVYNWQTQKSWKGTCRRLVIGLVGNGVLPYADFQFK